MSQTSELLARRIAATSVGHATTHPIFVKTAKGAEVVDVEGNSYVDFASGVGVMSVGHSHSKVCEAITTQLQNYAHMGFMIAAYEPYLEVCEALNRRAPITDARSALFTTGAEAVEAAIKIARINTGRQGVIAFSGAWHGRTQLTAALTGKTGPLRHGNPPQPGVYHAPFPTREWSPEASIATLDHLLRVSVAPDQVAAIIIEPVQGEGGFLPAPPELIAHLRALCTQHEICLIADEIQCGFGRTGRFFAIEHHGIEPDLIIAGKAMGGGLPLSAVTGSARLMNTVPAGALGGTYAGNPVACAAALAVMQIIDADGLLARAVDIGATMRDRLTTLQRNSAIHPIGAIRQTGAMVAFDVVDDIGAYDAARAKAIAELAREEGVLVLPCGYHGATIRLSTPLNISQDALEVGLSRLVRAVMRSVGTGERVHA